MAGIIKVEIFEYRYLFIDNKEMFNSRIMLTDEQFLTQLLYIRFLEEIKLLDLEKKCVYGIQFYRFDGNDRMRVTKQWNKLFDIHIHLDLGYKDLQEIYKSIGYKLIYLKRNPYNSITTYELRPLIRKLKNS